MMGCDSRGSDMSISTTPTCPTCGQTLYQVADGPCPLAEYPRYHRQPERTSFWLPALVAVAILSLITGTVAAIWLTATHN